MSHMKVSETHDFLEVVFSFLGDHDHVAIIDDDDRARSASLAVSNLS